MFCSKCGQEVSEESVYCNKCGASFVNDQRESVTDNIEQSANMCVKSKTTMQSVIISIIALVVGTVIGIIIMLIFKELSFFMGAIIMGYLAYLIVKERTKVTIYGIFAFLVCGFITLYLYMWMEDNCQNMLWIIVYAIPYSLCTFLVALNDIRK